MIMCKKIYKLVNRSFEKIKSGNRKKITCNHNKYVQILISGYQQLNMNILYTKK